jgi:1-acyl-sn-glycerol-3-phosphate acyltransferase
MPTATAEPGLKRNLVWRIIQFPVSVLFRVWSPLKVQGLEHIDPKRPGLLISNHQSFLDPLLLAVRMVRPVSYLARDGLFRVPILGWVLRSTYVMPISRTATRSATIRSAVERLDRGFLVGIFPEGTRNTGEVGDFRPGMTAILRRSRVPVYPVGISGADKVWPRGGWFIRPRRIRVVFGSPITPEQVESLSQSERKSDLVEYIRSRVVELHEQARSTNDGSKS